MAENWTLIRQGRRDPVILLVIEDHQEAVRYIEQENKALRRQVRDLYGGDDDMAQRHYEANALVSCLIPVALRTDSLPTQSDLMELRRAAEHRG